MAEEVTPEAQAPAPKAAKRNTLLLAIVLLGVVAGVVVGSALLLNSINSRAETGDEPAADGTALDRSVTEHAGPALYYPILPPLTANFSDELGRRRFMQVGLEVMARKQSIIDDVKNHDAVIRNALLLALGETSYESAITREGKEALRQKCLEEIHSVMSGLTDEPGIEAVYFTSFVVQ